MKPLVTKCKHKGLVMGGFAGDASSHFEIDNDPDLHDPGKVPDPSKQQVPAARPASDGEAPRAGVGGGQLDCAARSESHVDHSTAVDTIRYFCDGNAGHQFPSNGSEHVLFAWYYNPDHPADAHTPIGLGVYQPAGRPSPKCSYRLDPQLCVTQLTTAMNACNDFRDNITLGATLRDADCGWLYEFSLKPDDQPLGVDKAPVIHIAAPAEAEVPVVAVPRHVVPRDLVPRQSKEVPGPWTESSCANRGYSFPLAAWDEGLQAFCAWADGRVIRGPSKDLQFTFLWWSSSGHLHKQCYSIWRRCSPPFPVTRNDCLAAMSPLINECAHGDQSRAGWANEYLECTVWTVDNDPDRRRPEAAADPSH
ncbi:hypothetical protein LTR53_013630 [Teratosphaeriaceae sp. CCFEE 6253]|nr:hypothetical protein LTR53_013630 [Teratosphaeriaceae sp. CCFEE 6253]